MTNGYLATVSAHAQTSPDPGNPSGNVFTLDGSVSRSSSNGIFVFDDLGLSADKGEYTLLFEASFEVHPEEILPVVSNPFTVTPLVVETEPSSTPANDQPFPQQPVIEVRDEFGNLKVDDNETIVSVTVIGGSGSLRGTLNVIAVGGVATFTDLALTGDAGDYQLIFSAVGMAPVTSNLMSLLPEPPEALRVQTHPSATVASGSNFALQPVIWLVDQYDARVTGDNSTFVEVAVSGGGILLGTTIQQAVNGVVTFTNLGLSGSVDENPYQLTFTAKNLTSADSTSITLTHGAAEQLAMTTQPPLTTLSGSILESQPVVEVQDAYGNLVVSDNGRLISASISGGGVVTGTPSKSTSGGRAAFTGLGISGDPGDYTLEFSASGLTPIVSDFIEIRSPNVPPVLTGDLQLEVIQGSCVTLRVSDAYFEDPDDTASQVTFVMQSPVYGDLKVNGSNETRFTGAQLRDGLVSYCHTAPGLQGESLSSLWKTVTRIRLLLPGVPSRSVYSPQTSRRC